MDYVIQNNSLFTYGEAIVLTRDTVTIYVY